MSKKNPNRSPDKGFIGELARPKAGESTRDKFDWSSHVVKPSRIQGMSTERKLSKQTPAKPSQSNVAAELRQHIDNRRKK